MLPTDPLLADQWHLGNSTPGLLDLNVRGVWDPTSGPAYTGAGVWTVVIDDGFDYLHSDLAPNYHQELDFDFDGANDFDPFGLNTDAHGTAVMGIIGAAANGSGVVGVAYDSELVGYRVESLISDAWLGSIAEAITAAATNAGGDVANISQGIANDANSEWGFGYTASRFDDIETAIHTAVSTGRDGLGMTIVKSAGNSRTDDYDVNADDWTNDTRQVVVAAVDQDGFVSSYSSYGAALLVSGFGTPGEVVTTDRVGSAGYNATDFTDSFNGTSSAAPMVAGVVALMYEANPNLGWRDVQTILANSARHVGSDVGTGPAGAERYLWDFNAAGTWNGGGLHFSNDYGYGLVDALAAVRMAETWFATGLSAETSANEFTNSMDVLNATVVIPDGAALGNNFTGTAGFDDQVERVTVTVTFSTSFTADLELYLISPEGTVSELIDDVGGSSDFNGTWTFESQAFRGERAAGYWSLRIVDDASGDTLTVSDIVIQTFGSASHDDRYIYTDEYGMYAGLFGHSTSIEDTNGSDTVDASAVTSDSVINLTQGAAGSIAGQAFSVAAGTVIENAIGGDGNDTLTGNDLANTLIGGRGNDTLNGRAGADTMVGGVGNDTYFVDTIIDGILEQVDGGIDTVRSWISWTLGDNLERLELLGTTQNYDATGNALENDLFGNNGRNILNGRAGADRMEGRGGNDIYYVDTLADQVIESAGGGIDTVRAWISWTLGANLDRLELLGTTQSYTATGNANNNDLFGNNGNNVLDGRSGADHMEGRGGNDTYIVDDAGDQIIEAAAGGTDIVKSWISWTLGAEIERLQLLGGANNNATGNALANQLYGNSGNNALNGSTGADRMEGFGGNDSYIVDDAGDQTIEAFGGGTDTVRSWISWTLASNVERLQLLGGANNSATGNSLANDLFGNSGNNALNGGGDADRMEGFGGNDSYIVDNAGDQTIEAAGGGTDTVRSWISWTLGAEVERLQLLGTTEALNGAGNTLDNEIFGNAGDNRLAGLAGNDTLTGGGGMDTFIFNTPLNAVTNVDTITDFSVADDTIRLDDAIFAAVGPLGTLAAAAFHIGAAATTAAHRIVYNSATGALIYDSNGSAAGGATQFAILGSGLALTNADFLIA